MEFDMNKFNSRLKALMKSHDMSENDLAKKIGVSNVTICRYLNKERIPHVDIVVKIANPFYGTFFFKTDDTLVCWQTRVSRNTI